MRARRATTHGLVGGLAVAGVSRATLYRLFPGKSALFDELIREFSPWEPVADVIDAMPRGRPEEVMPAVARVIAEAIQGRVGLLLRMVFFAARRLKFFA